MKYFLQSVREFLEYLLINKNGSLDLFFCDIICMDRGGIVMNWKQIIINLLVMAVVYAIFYGISYCFSKRYAIKRGLKRNGKEK